MFSLTVPRVLSQLGPTRCARPITLSARDGVARYRIVRARLRPALYAFNYLSVRSNFEKDVLITNLFYF